MSNLFKKARIVSGALLVNAGWRVLPESGKNALIELILSSVEFEFPERGNPAGQELEAEDARQEAENARLEAEDNLRRAEARAEEAQRQAVAERPLGPTPDEDEPSYRLERGQAVRDRFKHMND